MTIGKGPEEPDDSTCTRGDGSDEITQAVKTSVCNFCVCGVLLDPILLPKLLYQDPGLIDLMSYMTVTSATRRIGGFGLDEDGRCSFSASGGREPRVQDLSRRVYQQVRETNRRE
jgi:hypothetical protein